jgi:hypothetical protein
MPEMIDESQNESNLMQRREDRRTLEKMRRKLATSGTMSKKGDLPHHGKKRSLRIWPFAVGAALLLIALNFGLGTKQAQKALGANAPAANALKLPPDLALDEQARFWAYAVYDVPKLRIRFRIPKGIVVDNKAARIQLEQILAENLGPEIRNEIFVFQQKEPPPKAPAKSKSAKAKPGAKNR